MYLVDSFHVECVRGLVLLDGACRGGGAAPLLRGTMMRFLLQGEALYGAQGDLPVLWRRVLRAPSAQASMLNSFLSTLVRARAPHIRT